MDFLFVSEMPDVSFPATAIDELAAWPEFTVREHRDGFLAFTGSRYVGFDPYEDERRKVTTIVLGDPLFDWVTRTDDPAGRTRQVAERLARENLQSETFRAFHAGTIIRIRPASNDGLVCEVRTDRLGGLSVFVATRGTGLVISSSPDLIALAIGAELDELSCKELVVQSRVSFPFTLYQEIRELAPRFVHRFRRGSLPKRLVYSTTEVAPVTIAGGPLDLRGARAALSTHFDEFYARLDANVSTTIPIVSTLSAGWDSRTVTAAAMRRFGNRVTALTMAPSQNEDFATAHLVAETLGIRQHGQFWDTDVFKKRFTAGRALLVGSHRRWTDAHFLGTTDSLDVQVGLGGFFSDPVFNKTGAMNRARRSAIQDGTLSPDAPPNVITRHFFELDEPSQDALNARARAALVEVQPFALDDLRFSIPLGRALESAHDRTLQLAWAQYEPFATERTVAIVREIASLRIDGFKDELFADILEAAGVLDIPTNPDPKGEGVGAWLSFSRVRDEDPAFAEAIESMVSETLSMLGLSRRVMRDRTLLVNIFWANQIVTKYQPAA